MPHGRPEARPQGPGARPGGLAGRAGRQTGAPGVRPVSAASDP